MIQATVDADLRDSIGTNGTSGVVEVVNKPDVVEVEEDTIKVDLTAKIAKKDVHPENLNIEDLDYKINDVISKEVENTNDTILVVDINYHEHSKVTKVNVKI